MLYSVDKDSYNSAINMKVQSYPKLTVEVCGYNYDIDFYNETISYQGNNLNFESDSSDILELKQVIKHEYELFINDCLSTIYNPNEEYFFECNIDMDDTDILYEINLENDSLNIFVEISDNLNNKCSYFECTYEVSYKSDIFNPGILFGIVCKTKNNILAPIFFNSGLDYGLESNMKEQKYIGQNIYIDNPSINLSVVVTEKLDKFLNTDIERIFPEFNKLPLIINFDTIRTIYLDTGI